MISQDLKLGQILYVWYGVPHWILEPLFFLWKSKGQLGSTELPNCENVVNTNYTVSRKEDLDKSDTKYELGGPHFKQTQLWSWWRVKSFDVSRGQIAKSFQTCYSISIIEAYTGLIYLMCKCSTLSTRVALLMVEVKGHWGSTCLIFSL